MSLVLLCWKRGFQATWKLIKDILDRITRGSEAHFKDELFFAEANSIGGDSLNCTSNGNTQPSVNADKEAKLMKELEELITCRSQDWFLFIVLSLILLDVVFFSVLNNWAAPIALLILEGFALFGLGEKMGMASICEVISTLAGIAANKLAKK